MSVTLYGDEKFTGLYSALTRYHGYTGKLGWFFGYPEGWKKPEGVDHQLKAWLDDLKRANTLTYNRQYGEHAEQLTGVDYSVRPSRWELNPIQLYVSLRGLRYNLVDNGGTETNLNKAMEKLNDLIDSIGQEIISKLPGYDKAVSENW